MRSGRKSEAQTPSPKKDRIKGSKVNPKGSASSTKSAKSIELSDSITTTLENKRDEYNAKHPSGKVTLSTLKAVFRRGAGAFSSSHRPNITRSGWAFARVNKFLLKKGGTKVKAAYVQDDDLMQKGAILDSIDPYGQLKSLIEEGVVDLKFYETTPEHAKEYGIQANKPFYVQNLIVIEKERLKSIGKKVLHHLDNYAIENGNDVIFGYLADKSSFSRDSRQSFYSDIDMIKNWLHNNGYAINNETNEFHKVVKTNNEDGGEVSSSVRKFYDWFINWYKDGKIYEKMNIFISIPNELTKIDTKSNSVILDLFEKIDQNIDAKTYLKQITNKADEFGVTIDLEAIPRYKHITDSEKKKKITKEYLQSYYSKFSFKPIKGAWMKREPKSKYENGGLIAPNGNKSNLTHEQWHLVRNPEFKAWFGDWENDPENSSKVVDVNGEPLVVYYGTYAKEQFKSFDFDKADLGFHFGTYEQAKDRSKTKIGFKGYESIVNPYFLNIKKKFYITDIGEFEYPQRYLDELISDNLISESEAKANKFYEPFYRDNNKKIREFLLKKHGKNIGFEYNNKYEGEGKSFIVLHPNQIKLADGSNTTFDANNPDIRYEDGGDLGQEIICRGCGWRWNTNQSDEFDKYICHRCGFDNRTFYDSDPIGKYHLGGDMSMHLAPNGKPSNLTHEQWHLVRTPEFKAWFGDWERLELLKIKDSGVDEVTLDNIAKDVSKVVDENGEPMVVYHGSANKFNVFDRKRVGENYRESERGGFFFTQKLNTAKNYARLHTNLENDGFVYYCFLNIKNPLVRNTNSEYYSPADRYDVSRDEYIRECFNGNFDGIIINGTKKDNLYVVNSSNKIKLADGSNTTFDSDNPDIRYEEGGLLKKAPSVLKIADKHNVDLETLSEALKDGIKVEMEHTKNRNVAKTIASHHLYESPKYYEKLKIMEKELNLDEHYEDIKKIYAIGGTTDPVLSFSTPTGEPTKLTYIQQVLVRTSAFKNFFGDWEYAAKQFVANGRQEYEYLYKNVSKVIDKITLEPKVVYHGTRVDSEFYVFDVSQQAGDGRPYGYFAHNLEYSQNFTTSSQRSMSNAQPFLYKCFVNVRNPFYAMTSEYYNIQRDAEYWKNEIAKTIALDKYTNQLDTNKLDTIKKVVDSQIGKYIDDTLGGAEYSFWILMARDKNKLFKYFLNNYRYDGIFYAEEFGGNYDVDNPAEFTEAVTIFEPSQVKLADGRNINFDPMNVDIRYAKGGDINNTENIEKTSNKMSKRENLRNLLLGDKYAEGGEVIADKLKDGNDGKKGGYFEGRSHDEGGIKAYNKDTGQMIEVEGEEVIITKGAVKDQEKREFEGEMLTNREILSRINQSGGGVSFAEGGEMKSSSCGCSGKKYKYGGEMMDDYSIVKIMNRPFEIINDNFADARAFADMLVEKLK
jgi:hypothetical protein